MPATECGEVHVPLYKMVPMHPMMCVQSDEHTHFVLLGCIAGGKCSSQQRQVFADLVHRDRDTLVAHVEAVDMKTPQMGHEGRKGEMQR